MAVVEAKSVLTTIKLSSLLRYRVREEQPWSSCKKEGVSIGKRGVLQSLIAIFAQTLSSHLAQCPLSSKADAEKHGVMYLDLCFPGPNTWVSGCIGCLDFSTHSSSRSHSR